MSNKNTIRRVYLIIRRIDKGDFPSKKVILDMLADKGCKVDPRTIDRDFEHIRSNFDLDITYNPQRKGYTIENAEDLDKTLYFMSLAESADILLASFKEKQGAMKYISISPSQTPRGTEYLQPILEALRDDNPRKAQRVITFDHTRYESGETVSYEVEPYLLKEFEGRWYMFAYVPELGTFRTFGLDRIANLKVSDKELRRDPKLAATVEKFDDIYGLIYEPDQRKDAPKEWVKLRGSDFVIKHLAALPLHSSQTIEGNTVSLKVIINPELTNKIMSFGEHIEVLAPSTLRERIKQRLTEALKKY